MWLHHEKGTEGFAFSSNDSVQLLHQKSSWTKWKDMLWHRGPKVTGIAAISLGNLQDSKMDQGCTSMELHFKV